MVPTQRPGGCRHEAVALAGRNTRYASVRADVRAGPRCRAFPRPDLGGTKRSSGLPRRRLQRVFVLPGTQPFLELCESFGEEATREFVWDPFCSDQTVKATAEFVAVASSRFVSRAAADCFV